MLDPASEEPTNQEIWCVSRMSASDHFMHGIGKKKKKIIHRHCNFTALVKINLCVFSRLLRSPPLHGEKHHSLFSRKFPVPSRNSPQKQVVFSWVALPRRRFCSRCELGFSEAVIVCFLKGRMSKSGMSWLPETPSQNLVTHLSIHVDNHLRER